MAANSPADGGITVPVASLGMLTLERLNPKCCPPPHGNHDGVVKDSEFRPFMMPFTTLSQMRAMVFQILLKTPSTAFQAVVHPLTKAPRRYEIMDPKTAIIPDPIDLNQDIMAFHLVLIACAQFFAASFSRSQCVMIKAITAMMATIAAMISAVGFAAIHPKIAPAALTAPFSTLNTPLSLAPAALISPMTGDTSLNAATAVRTIGVKMPTSSECLFIHSATAFSPLVMRSRIETIAFPVVPAIGVMKLSKMSFMTGATAWKMASITSSPAAIKFRKAGSADSATHFASGRMMLFQIHSSTSPMSASTGCKDSRTVRIAVTKGSRFRFSAHRRVSVAICWMVFKMSRNMACRTATMASPFPL